MIPGKEGRPSICLAMIVRDEAHVIHELVAAVAPSIDFWVIVDTGSTDGTQDAIRRLMGERGIPGELHERPWKDFGHNRTEALALAQGRCDYIWMMDADDTVQGTVDFSGLHADGYSMRLHDGTTYWRRQLFRNGVPWRYAGVLHEVAVCDVPCTEARLEGDYRIESRRLGARNRDPRKYARDAAVLQAEVDRDPDDRRSVFYLAQSYAWAGDLAKARRWFERRAEMGGWDEEVYYALYRAAEVMETAGEPWPLVQDAYLRAWSRRPTRAEPLYAIARRCRVDRQYRLGHLFAERAANIPLPQGDLLFVRTDVYEWRALDEQAVCASWIGRHAETFAICQQLLARSDLPDDDRQRIAANRDLMARQMLEGVAAGSPAPPASIFPPAPSPSTPGSPSPRPTRDPSSRAVPRMLVGLGHPRCGTAFAASLLAANGVAVRHEAVGPEGIVSWMQVAKRGAAPWGETLTEYPPGARVFLVARSPLAALTSVATENQQIRSIGLRSQLLWERRRVDMFAGPTQTAGEGVYDFFGWAVMSLAWWYDICFDEKPESVFRIEHTADDELLGHLVGRQITREGRHVWQNAYGPHKKSGRLEFPISELGRVPKEHLAKLVEITERLGYPEDAATMRAYL